MCGPDWAGYQSVGPDHRYPARLHHVSLHSCPAGRVYRPARLLMETTGIVTYHLRKNGKKLLKTQCVSDTLEPAQ